MSRTVNFYIDKKYYQLPIIHGAYHDNKAIDISQLREKSGWITFDPGFKNTGVTKSSISFIDGKKGILLYRGYPIEQIIKKCSFIETCYLILNGEIPNINELNNFSKKIKNFSFLNKEFYNIFSKIPCSYHPMGILSTFINILIAFFNSIKNEDMYFHLLAKFPIMAALTYRKKFKLPPSYSDKNKDYVFNLINMFFHNFENKENNSIIVNSLEKLLILHVDHEQNCSTTAVRLLGSSRSNLLSSISAAIGALWGNLHGGANQAVIEMLEIILKDGGNVEKWIEKAKNKKDPFRLMGFGHRIYKNFDPRAIIAKNIAENLIKKLGYFNDPILDLAKKIEKYALSDSYFIEKRLYPNIDFYSGIIYKIIGFPKEMFTVMFAIGRLPGWIAHWKEMMKNEDPIGRPRQIYIGRKKRNIDKKKCGRRGSNPHAYKNGIRS